MRFVRRPGRYLLALVLLTATGASAQSEESSSLAIEQIVVEPAEPGPDTLCKLHVKIRNDGSEVASQFGFTVTINDQDLHVYGNQLFMYAVEPGSSLEIPLYNFWTTETSRPMPADGKLNLSISLDEAQWMKIEMVEEVETWTPLGSVEDLPVESAITLSLSGAPG
jgi:hypothetical protein